MRQGGQEVFREMLAGGTSGAIVGALIGALIWLAVSDGGTIWTYAAAGGGVGFALGAFYWPRPLDVLADLFTSVW